MNSDQESIFNSEETPKPAEDQQAEATQPTKSTEADPLSEYVGEGKKFDSLEKFVNSFKAKEEHISTLESENREYRESLSKVKELEEMIEEYRNERRASPEPQQKAGIDPSEIESIVQSTLSKAEQEKAMKANTQKVANSLTEMYGDSAEKLYIEVAKANGMSPAEMNQMAATRPQAVLNLVKALNPPRSTPSTSTGSINSEALQRNSTPEAPSARVKFGASTKEMAAAWRAAAPKIDN